MHIPDGFLSPPVWASLDAVTLPCAALFARRAQRQMDESKIPLLGVMGAFVFAAQMINFPVGVGTSGHLVGGTLLAVTLGPVAASVVMTAILLVQALVFQDGGVLALGANVMNMGIFGVWAGYLSYRALAGTRGRNFGIFVGGVLSVMVSGCLALIQLLVSGQPMPEAAVAMSLLFFVVNGLFEGAITVAVVKAIEKINPGWVRSEQPQGRMLAAGLLSVAVLLVAVGVLFASTHPDGLERFAETVGIAHRSRAVVTTPLSNYEWAGLSSAWLRKASAGLAGLGLIYLVCAALGRLAARRGSA